MAGWMAGTKRNCAVDRTINSPAQTAEVTLEFARFRAPRTLTHEQARAIAHSLKEHGSFRYVLCISSRENEFREAAGTVRQVCDFAGWAHVDWIAAPGQGIWQPPHGIKIGLEASVNDIAVGHCSDAPQPVQEAAYALAISLSKQHIPAYRMLIGPSGAIKQDPDTIQIRIGRKT